MRWLHASAIASSDRTLPEHSVVAEPQNWTREHDVALTRPKVGPIPAPQISENQWIRSRMSAAPGAPAPPPQMKTRGSGGRADGTAAVQELVVSAGVPQTRAPRARLESNMCRT